MSCHILIIGYAPSTKHAMDALLAFPYKVTLCVKRQYIQFLKKFHFNTDQCDIIYYDSINEDELNQSLAPLDIDYVMVFALGDKVPESITSIAKVAALNFHPGKLPGYRGADPIYWMLRQNEKQIEISAHIMTQEWDAGDIVYEHPIDIDRYDTYSSLWSKFNHELPVMLQAMKPMLDAKKLPRTVQGKGTYFSKKHPKNFVVDWSMTAAEIEHLVRCHNCKEPLLMLFDNKIVKLFEVAVSSIQSSVMKDVLVSENKLYVAASDFYLELRVFMYNNTIFSAERFLKWKGIA